MTVLICKKLQSEAEARASSIDHGCQYIHDRVQEKGVPALLCKNNIGGDPVLEILPHLHTFIAKVRELCIVMDYIVSATAYSFCRKVAAHDSCQQT